MDLKFVNWKFNDFLLFIVFLQTIVYVIVLLNIPIARQVIGFLYFTFIPGFLLLKLLRIYELNWLENLLLSVGLSIAFLMLAGLLINELGPLLGILKPLSTMPLLIFLNSLILVFAFIAYSRDHCAKPLYKKPCLHLSALLLIVLPIMSITGAMCVNLYKNNTILLIMILMISSVFITIVLSNKTLSSVLYPFAILMIAIALLYHSTFISNYFVTCASDIGGEYFAFKVTESSACWSSVNHYTQLGWSIYDRLNAMLSVTILPTLYSNLLSMDTIWMFKLLFPVFFSLVPLGLYRIWQMYVGKKYAYISTFLFMAEMTFYTEMLRLTRQIIAELFFVLLLLTILNRKMKSDSKFILFTIFSFGLVVSHYGTAEIFLFFISTLTVSLIILKRPSKRVTIGMVILLFAIMFSWYIYTSRSAVFDCLLEYGDFICRQLDEFFNLEARGKTVLTGLGLEAPPTIWNTISRVFAYLTEAFIILGFLGQLTKRIKVPFDVEYQALVMLSMGFLAMLILIPGLANTMNMTRFYHVLLFFLSPLCILGAKTVMNIISKKDPKLKMDVLLLAVLIPYFLFQSGFVYEIVGNDSWSVPLSGYRMNPVKLYGQLGYSTVYSVYGAQWLSKNIEVGRVPVYADLHSIDVELKIYGLIYPWYVQKLDKITHIKANGAVYTSSLNVIEEIAVGGRELWNLSELMLFNDMNLIYSNGGSHVYKNSNISGR